MRTLVIGDIHGGLLGLRQLLERAAPGREDRLIFLGDYVDGWSQAAETVDFLITLATRHTCIFLRGNHDDLCLDWLRDNRQPELWLRSGGAATQASYRGVGAAERQRHIQFLESTLPYFLDTDSRLYVHAGFTNQRGVEHEYFSKTFFWDRTLWEMAQALNPGLDPSHPSYPPRLRLYREVYIGHTPVTRLGYTTPQRAAGICNVDTGAAFKGPLSALEVSSGQLWQSDPVHLLYPEEQGRN
ncbi:metallophosphoesterase [Robiginitalea sp. M366]|uniref:metallophosphoesterase n=1 Tax=Robiginitalea aestuariiviva TaxID=3036903 RepID=UPI00240DA41D|nr:metallophosphoesterase [Robiginitalea aestuariiviva]MDG1571635.1 metallophosphoesterase [Robiginitalea aestuariiviva]